MLNALSLYAPPPEPEQFDVGNFAAPIQQKQFMNALAALGARNDPMKASGRNVLSGLSTGEGPAPAPTSTKAGGKASSPISGRDWLQYANEGAIRDDPISEDLIQAMSFLGDMGVTMKVYSGGQDAKGHGTRRTGSTRHDHGDAADARFYKDGRQIYWDDPSDLPIFEEIVRRAKANGATGIGAGPGYMGRGTMHVGFGNEAVWGQGGKSANAPSWLRQAAHQGISERSDALAAAGL